VPEHAVSKVLMSVSAIIINTSNIPAVSKCIKVDYDQIKTQQENKITFVKK
jgi:hypothetical protein